MTTADADHRTSPGGRVYLVRHGRTALNARGVLRGRLDPPLDEVGLAEAEATAAELAAYGAVTAIVSSPLTRAMQTAQAIAATTGASLSTDARLADRDYAAWAGHAPEEVIARWGSLSAAPGVESEDQVRARSRSVLEAQRELLGRGDGAGNVILVSHDVVNRLLLAEVDADLGTYPLRQRTACWNRLRPLTGGWDVEVIDAKITPDIALAS